MAYDRKYSTTAKGRARRGPAMGRRRAPPKKTKALTKVEKKQVATIAKRVVNKQAESKYFECNTLFNNIRDGMYKASISGSGKIWVKGYMLDNSDSNTATWPTYGYDAQSSPFPIESLNMSQSVNTGDSARDGKYVSPSLCQTEMLLRRDAIDLTDVNNFPEKAMEYHVRVIRVVPRNSSGQNTDRGDAQAPRDDLFVDERGQPIGVALGIDALALQMYRVNTRKYKLIMDKTISVKPPVVSAEVASGAGGAQGDVSLPTVLNSVPAKMTFRHDLGKKLYYDLEQDLKPTAGLKQEYILFHAFFPTQVQSNVEPEELFLTVKSVSTFKDL